MSRAAEILKANRAAARAERQAERAAIRAFSAAADLRWATVCSPTSATLTMALERALRAGEAAVTALQKREAAQQSLAAAWRADVQPMVAVVTAEAAKGTSR